MVMMAGSALFFLFLVAVHGTTAPTVTKQIVSVDEVVVTVVVVYNNEVYL